MMGYFEEAVQKALNCMQNDPMLSDITFHTEYPVILKASPLKRIHAAVGLGKTAVAPCALGDYLGIDSLSRALFGQKAELTLRVDLYVPLDKGGRLCQETFSAIVDVLLAQQDFAILETGCGGIGADRSTEAFHLEAWIRLNVYLGLSGKKNIRSALIKGVV